MDLRQEVLKGHAREFYRNLYKKEDCQLSNTIDWDFPEVFRWDRLWLNRQVIAGKVKKALFQMGVLCWDRLWLNRQVIADKVKKTLFQMGGNKASGLDGFPTIFFLKY